jgi:hypothetical protein
MADSGLTNCVPTDCILHSDDRTKQSHYAGMRWDFNNLNTPLGRVGGAIFVDIMPSFVPEIDLFFVHLRAEEGKQYKMSRVLTRSRVAPSPSRAQVRDHT